MKNLQARVEKMLAGEQKRREVALKWLEEVEEILIDVAEDIWGRGVCYGYDCPTYTVDITQIRDGKKKDAGFYFRYATHRGHDQKEYYGFYKADGEMNVWGTEIEDLRGSTFWHAIQVILEWLPQVIEAMEKREESREQLLQKINLD